MPMPENSTRIWMALKGRVQEAAGDLQIAWPGEVFEASGPFLAVSEVLAAPERRSFRGTDPHRARGTLALRLSVPVRDKFAPEVCRERAAQIAAAFPADLWLTFDGQRVRIREKGAVLAGYPDGGWHHWPLQVRYEAAL